VSGTVVVVGDALLDVTVRPATPMRPGADVPAQVRVGCGGQGANLAVRLARQGIGVELTCGSGDDAAASLVSDALRAEGIRLHPVAVSATGTVVILLDAAGERTMLSQRVPFAAGSTVPMAAWTVISGYSLLEADAVQLARAVAERATRRVVVGCTVPASSRTGWRAAVAALRPHLLILNREEAAAMEPIDELATGTVVTAADLVTASIGEASVSVIIPAGRLATDTTGAGDAFAATVVAGLVDAPWPPSRTTLETAITAATLLAGEVARAPGAQARVAAETDR